MATATPRPVHTSTICQGGTACQAQGVDRRLGDFFTIEIDNAGHVWAGYSDTAEGGATALPGFVHQKGGIPFVKQKATNRPGGGGSTDVPDGDDQGGSGEGEDPDDEVAGESVGSDGDAEVAAAAEEPATLAATGITVLKFVAIAFVLMLVGWAIRRRTATEG